MNQDYSNILSAMERYLEMVSRLANSMQRGQEALVGMDLAAFEQLTAEQEGLCRELKQLQVSAAADADRDASPPRAQTNVGERTEFERQREILGQHCLVLQERVRHLNRVNQILLHRTRQSFELLLRLTVPDGTYSAPASPQFTVCEVGKE